LKKAVQAALEHQDGVRKGAKPQRVIALLCALDRAGYRVSKK
jgi:hypothetical protein